MTDMRATERLLEVIEEACRGDIAGLEHGWASAVIDIQEAVKELRRRGDTLVRRDDLRVVLELDEIRYVDASVRSRLENAIGG